MKMSEALIELKNIDKIYRQGEQEIKALDGVSMTIEKGEFVAIVGCSGSGKSTLMNMIGCLDQPTYGEYTLDGVDVLKLKDKELSKIRNKEIGFIFQGFNLVSGLTAFENVELPLIYRKMSKSKRKEVSIRALKKVSLLNRMTHRPSEMSGGQQQRVAIARAVVTEPTLLLADEPTGALDQKTGRQVMELFHQLHREGRTIIMITHDLNIARHGSRIVRILDGKLAENADIEAEESLYGTEETPAPDGGVIVTTESETRTEYQGRGEDDV